MRSLLATGALLEERDSLSELKDKAGLFGSIQPIRLNLV